VKVEVRDVGTDSENGKYGPPPETTGAFILMPIAAGTYANAAHWSYVLVRASCIATDDTTISKSDTTAALAAKPGSVARRIKC
jgi:hypothetical protein